MLGRFSKTQTDAPASGLRYDDEARSLQHDDSAPVVLRAKSFAAFRALADAHPDPLSKDGLIEAVWGQNAVSDDSVVQCIADIRRALDDRDHKLVQTVPGAGYRLTRPATAVGGAVPDTPAATHSWKPLAGGALVAIGIGIAVAIFAPFGKDGPNALPLVDTSTPAIAVGRFENLADDDRLRRLSRGLTHDIVIDLTQLSTLRVLSPTLVSEATTPEAEVTAYADLGARYVVSGTIQAGGGTLRISSFLTDTTNGEVVWVRQWEQPEEDFFAIQDEIVAGVVNELANRWSGKIAGLGAELATSDPSSSLLAYDYAQLGVAAFSGFDTAALEQAELYFRKALEIDPYYGEAWASLAFVLGARTTLAPVADFPALNEARANAGRQARHLGNESAASMLAASWTAAYKGNRAECVRRLNVAITKAPNDADILAMAAIQASLTTDLHAEALAWGQEALRLNAAPPDWYHIGPGLAHFFLEDPAASAEHLDKAPRSVPLVLAYLAAAQAAAGQKVDAATLLASQFPDFTAEHYLAIETFYPHDKRAVVSAAFVAADLP